jgi:hypothetical protein
MKAEYELLNSQLLKQGFTNGEHIWYSSRHLPVYAAFIVYTRKDLTHSTTIVVEGNYKNATITAMKGLFPTSNSVNFYGSIQEFPHSWYKEIATSKTDEIFLEKNNQIAQVKWMNLKKIAQKYGENCTTKPIFDEQNNYILDKNQFLKEFEKSITNNYLKSTYQYFIKNAQILKTPTNSDIEKILSSAEDIYDSYMQIPVGSMMVSNIKGRPLTISKKIFTDFRWSGINQCSYDEKRSAIVPTADPGIQILSLAETRVKNKSPALILNTANMLLSREIRLIPKDYKVEFLNKAIDSLGKFNSIKVHKAIMGMDKNTQNKINTDGTWYPTRGDLMMSLYENMVI